LEGGFHNQKWGWPSRLFFKSTTEDIRQNRIYMDYPQNWDQTGTPSVMEVCLDEFVGGDDGNPLQSGIEW
jgi:hypothetical protein